MVSAKLLGLTSLQRRLRRLQTLPGLDAALARATETAIKNPDSELDVGDAAGDERPMLGVGNDHMAGRLIAGYLRRLIQ